MAKCVVVDCDRPHARANYCVHHYREYVLGVDGLEGPP